MKPFDDGKARFVSGSANETEAVLWSREQEYEMIYQCQDCPNTEQGHNHLQYRVGRGCCVPVAMTTGMRFHKEREPIIKTVLCSVDIDRTPQSKI